MHWISNEKYHFFFRLSIRFLLAMPSQLKILTLLAMLIIKQLRWFYFHEWCSLHWSVWISFQVAFTACSNIHLLINRLGEQELCQQGKENIREVLNSRTIPKRAFTYVTQGVGRSLKAARIVRVLALHPAPMSLSLFSLKHKVAVISGCTRGIGRSMALGLAEGGAGIKAIAHSPAHTHTHTSGQSVDWQNTPQMYVCCNAM